MVKTTMRLRYVAICTSVLLSCFQILPTLALEEDLLAKYPMWESDAEAKAMSVVIDLDGDDIADVVASDGSSVWLHSGRTGSVIWKQKLKSWTMTSPMIANLEIGDIHAVVVRLPHYVEVINLDDRSTIWTASLAGLSLGLAYREEVVTIIPDVNGDGVTDVALDSNDSESITILDGHDGGMIWEKGLNGYVMSILSVPDIDGNDVDDVVVCVRFADQTHILCLRGNDGSVLWNSSMPTVNHGISSTYLPQGVIIVSSTSARYLDLTIALDSETGEPLWNVSDLGGHAKPFRDVYETVPNVLVSSEEQGVVLLDWETGDEIWKEETVGKPQKILITDDLNGDECEDVVVTVCVGEEGDYLYAIEGKEGKFVWKYQPFTPLEVSQLASMDDDVDNDGVNDVLIAWYDYICLLGGSNIITVTEYNRMLSRHCGLYSEYRELHDVYSDLLLEHNVTMDNYDSLVMDYETLSDTFEELQKDHEYAIGLLDELETDYETLSTSLEQVQVDYKAVTELLDETIRADATTSNLMYAFLGTTVLFALATMYLIMRLRGR